jgi:hypothetical protein
LPRGYRTAEQDASAIIKVVFVSLGILAGVGVLLGIGYVAISSANKMLTQAKSEQEATPDDPAASGDRQASTVRPPWLENIDSRSTDRRDQAASPRANGSLSPIGSSAADSAGSMTDAPYGSGSIPSGAPSAIERAPSHTGFHASHGHVEDSRTSGLNPNSFPASGTAGLPSTVIRWWEQPGSPRAGLRRVGTATPPYLHYSWMCELLPYLGHEELYNAFDFNKPWMDERNLQLTGAIVPEFQNPTDDRKRYKGYPFEGMALTHFVGMSGIEDGRNVVAAALPRSDPRAGIFGYDEVAAIDDISDGTSNTIMIVGSGELASPWALGGGGTVRGARQPYFDRWSGFGSRGRQSEGTLAVMADGSVRFISSDIHPTAFRAMCTIHGQETIDVSRWAEPSDLDR